MVCSELIYRAFDGIAELRLPLQRRYGRATLAPGDLLAQALVGTAWRVRACVLPGDRVVRESDLESLLLAQADQRPEGEP